MLCTNCRQRVRPVVALDIDGTLGDFHGHFIKFINNYLGHSGNGQFYYGHNPMHEWFEFRYKEPYEVWRDIKLAYRQGGQKRTMPALPWASMLAQNVRDLDVELWITTTRPYLRLDSIDPDTRHWLERNDIMYDYLMYDDHKYHQLMEQVGGERVVAVFDDLNDDLWEAKHAFGKETCVLAASSYNSGYHDQWLGQIAIDGKQAYELIRQRVEAYRETEGHIRARIGDSQPAQRQS